MCVRVLGVLGVVGVVGSGWMVACAAARLRPNPLFSAAHPGCSETFVRQEPGESPNDRNDRAIRVVAAWWAAGQGAGGRRCAPRASARRRCAPRGQSPVPLPGPPLSPTCPRITIFQKHWSSCKNDRRYASRLAGKVRVVLLTDDADSRRKAGEAGVAALASLAYARGRAGEAPELQDLVSAAAAAEAAARGADGAEGDEGSGAPVGEGGDGRKPAKRSRVYAEHKPMSGGCQGPTAAAATPRPALLCCCCIWRCADTAARPGVCRLPYLPCPARGDAPRPPSPHPARRDHGGHQGGAVPPGRAARLALQPL